MNSNSFGHTSSSSAAPTSDGQPGSAVMGAIPRKKLPPIAASTTPGPPAASPVSPSTKSRVVLPRAKPVASGGSSNTIQGRGSSLAMTTRPSPQPRSRSGAKSEKANSYIRLVSENPMVVSIKLGGIPLTEGLPMHRTMRAKRLRNYLEMEDTDTDDVMTDDEAAVVLARKKKQRSLPTSSSSSLSATALGAWGAEASPAGDMSQSQLVPTEPGSAPSWPGSMTSSLQDEGAIPLENGGDGSHAAISVDAPPPGVLATLWYSRECFMHVFVMEKVCGWKTRHKVALTDTTTNQPVLLSKEQATSWQQKALSSPRCWMDMRKRMEVSRIQPTHCPLVLAMAAMQKEALATKEGRPPAFRLASEEREEVLLVKWRGRSYLHCSWERASDIQRLDPSNNTARSKIRRFYQNQEMAYGLDWKKVLEEERTTAATIHSHAAAGGGGGTADEEGAQDDEYFPPQNLEIERVLACDENDMNMSVLAKQRSLNMKNEQEWLRQKDQDGEKHLDVVGSDSSKSTKALLNMVQDMFDSMSKEGEVWDPEDNVRYVVKWKGLPYAEMTWEYWRDIKRDAVDEAEDFWLRQKPPDLQEISQWTNRAHPHIRDFRKLQGSPVYGISTRSRPTLVGDDIQVEEEEGDAFQGFRLRSYQLEGVNWLLFNWWNKRSCILADEMGLGKTIQSAAFLQELQRQPATRIRGPFLIVAPLSLVGQWQSELKSWAPDLNVVLFHGSADARDFLVKQEFYFTDQFVPKATAIKLKKLHVTKFHVLITTYEVVLKELSVLSKIKWKTLIVDEAHRLKNPKSRLFEELASVPRDYCVLLTGTPIANATSELHALLHFANPSKFTDKDGFLERFGEMTDAKQVNELHSLLKPYLLRRVKEDVEKSLPPKEETILEVSLTPIQKTFYKAIYERNTSFLYRGTKPSNAPSLMNVMMELRKCCNHPYLVKGAEERILADATTKLLESGNHELGNDFAIDQAKIFAEQLVKSSGKMVLMEKLLHKLFTGSHKVLVFSQMVRVLDLLEELLKIKKYRYERLDGSTSSSSRAHAVDRFNRKSCQRFVMLLSTRAGGLGLNLTAADTVIIFDSDWNPQNDLQAMARAHRIGQTRAVRVYRLLTSKTYEMHMFHSASLKLGLERAVLSQNRDQGEDNEENKSKKKSEREAQAREIDELLKKGAYDVFRDEDDAEAEKFMETDIDQLLEHSSKKVTYGPSSTASLGSGLGSFSKASFVANTDDGAKDVDLDDPDFWSKAVGLVAPAETSEDVAAMLDDGVKRNRKQVQVYDPYAETAEAEQRKKDKAALEKMLEKEEKERQKLEKKMKKKEAQEKKKREREREEQVRNQQKAMQQEKKVAAASSRHVSDDTRKVIKELKPKKSKKNDRLRAIRRAENEDPVLERLKQAWEAPQRNRATAAIIRFGFGRFCKIRNEANLGGLPLQDVENFVRAYLYQLSLQVGVTLLARLHDREASSNLRPLFQEWLGGHCERELDWMCESVSTTMKLYLEVESSRRFIRIPLILSEPSYVEILRRGGALRALRRIGILVRLNKIMEDCLDAVLSSLGHEELGKRGCGTSDLTALDADLKSRYVTTEELALVVGSFFNTLHVKPPAAWWSRRCDIALIIGTFVHGFGNYEAMRNDMDLPFAEMIRRSAQNNFGCKEATQTFRVAAQAARECYDEALESARIKAELEVQAAVAAAAKAASKREEDAALLRKGGAEAEAVIGNMPETQVENAFAFDGTDSHFVTLPRMQKYVQRAILSDVSSSLFQGSDASDAMTETLVKAEAEGEGQEDGHATSERLREHHVLPMPDSRVLDRRVLLVLRELEKNVLGEAPTTMDCDVDTILDVWEKADDVLTNLQVRCHAMGVFFGDSLDILSEYAGVGFAGSACGTAHRTLNDGSDYAFGSASSQLAQVAYGTDAPRYLRALGVPMNITCFAVSGLAYADSGCVKQLLAADRLRYYGNEKDLGIVPTPGAVLAVEGEVWNPCIEKKTAELDGQMNPDEAAKEEKAVSVVPVDPVELIPEVFRFNAKLRAFVCLAVAFYGFPPKGLEFHSVDAELWSSIQQSRRSSHDIPLPGLFNREKFREVVKYMAPDVDIPDVQVLEAYIENFLLPHCLKLCVNGNGPTTRNARGSQGEYETAYGVSVHPEPSQPRPTPIPDPCLNLQQHSLEAIGHANAILRRVQLLRTCTFVCSGANRGTFSVVGLDAVARSRYMGSLQDMPIWWCPWIHDIALLFQAATEGLFSVIPGRTQHFCFSPTAVTQYLVTLFASDARGFPLARHTPMEQVAQWAERQAARFPSVYQLERRLAFFCAGVTADLEDHEARYVNLPMFDHGGWPRN